MAVPRPEGGTGALLPTRRDPISFSGSGQLEPVPEPARSLSAIGTRSRRGLKPGPFESDTLGCLPKPPRRLGCNHRSCCARACRRPGAPARIQRDDRLHLSGRAHRAAMVGRGRDLPCTRSAASVIKRDLVGATRANLHEAAQAAAYPFLLLYRDPAGRDRERQSADRRDHKDHADTRGSGPGPGRRRTVRERQAHG